MVKLNLEMKKKDLVWVSLFIVVLVAGIGIAYNTVPAEPAVMGHSLDEIELPSCAEGEFLQKTDSGWGCGSGGDVSSVGLDCHVVEASTLNPRLCCAADEIATGINMAELDGYKAVWESNGQCVQFSGTKILSTKQIMCCK